MRLGRGDGSVQDYQEMELTGGKRTKGDANVADLWRLKLGTKWKSTKLWRRRQRCSWNELVSQYNVKALKSYAQSEKMVP
jgi:hypothetical protein